jgi:hypothetical protein
MSVLSDFAKRNGKRRGGDEECKCHDHEYQIVHICFQCLMRKGKRRMRRAVRIVLA